ncbi:MAG: hypothetical protein LH630_01505 [Actinomycetia bacterium]|nr:hypothetical protein [Actinomycetes bacterium]
MTRLRWGAALAAIAVVSAGTALPAASDGDASRMRAGSLETALRFTFDHGESLKRGTV